jgi:hypothetical protein
MPVEGAGCDARAREGKGKMPARQSSRNAFAATAAASVSVRKSNREARLAERTMGFVER